MNARTLRQCWWAIILLAGLCLLSVGVAPQAGQQEDAAHSVTAAEMAQAKRLNQEVEKLYSQGKYDQAIPLARRFLAIVKIALGPNHPSVATALNNLALLYYAKGDYARAEPLYRRALAIDEKALGPNHPDVATALNNLAALY